MTTRPSRRTGAVVALVVVVLVGAGVVAARLLGGPAAVSTASGVAVALPEPLVDEPSPAWTLRPEGPVTGGAATTDGVVLSTATEVVEVDLDGGTTWSTRPSEPCSVLVAHPDHDDLVVCAGEGAVVGLDGDDGEERWRFDDGTVVSYVEDGAGFAGETDLGVLDLATGRARWSVDVTDEHAFGPDALFTAQAGELVARDLESGDERWSTSYDVTPTTDGAQPATPALTAVEGLLVLTSEVGAVAYDPEDGEELWRVGPGRDGMVAGRFADDRVWLLPVDESPSAPPARLEVHDAAGLVGDLETDPDAVAASFDPVVDDGDDLALDRVSGRLYDADLATLTTYDGSVALVAGGAYVTARGDAGGSVSFLPHGSDEPRWSVPVDYVETLDAAAADGLLLVVVDDEVRGYR